MKKIQKKSMFKACFPLGEFVRANREIKQLDWLATNTDDITTQSHSLFACSPEKNRQVENRLKEVFYSLQKGKVLLPNINKFCDWLSETKAIKR